MTTGLKCAREDLHKLRTWEELGLTWQDVFEISFIIEQLSLCLHSLPRDMLSGNADDDWASECDAPGDGGWTP